MTPEQFRDWLHQLLGRAAHLQDIEGHDLRIEALDKDGPDRFVVHFSDDTAKTITITDGGAS